MKFQHKWPLANLFLLSSFICSNAGASLEIEEITVTAQKRSEDLSEVPIAVTAFSGDKMNELQMRDTFDLANHTPGLNIAGTDKESKPQIFLRGVGNSDFQQGSVSPVASYADGVYQGANFSLAAQLLDLERVEVLKGPQGTLWGRNATGGLINYVAKKAEPGEEMNGNLRASYADYNEWLLEGAVSLPINEKLAARIAGKIYSSDGYFEASGGGVETDELSDWESYAIRANIKYEPTDDLSISTTVSYSDKDGSVAQAKFLGSLVPAGQTSCSRPGELGTSCADFFGNVAVSDPHENASQVDGFHDVQTLGLAVQVDYAFGDHTLTSITAYNDNEQQYFTDIDGSPTTYFFGSSDDEFQSFSQELRVASDYDGAMNWIAGVFYYEDELDFHFVSHIALFGPNTVRQAQVIDTETAAIFGEINFQLSDNLEAIIGARWTYDKRETDPEVANFNAITGQFNSKSFARANITGIIFDEPIDETAEEPSGRISLKYTLNDDTNLWFTAARGFKGGDANSGAGIVGAPLVIVEPEFLNSYEAGVKYSSSENNVAVDFSVFKYDYRDKQVFTEFGGTSVLSNAGEVSIDGAEVTVRWAPVEPLYIEAGASYTDAEFDKFIAPFGQNLAGNVPAYTPEFTFNTVIAYTWELSNGGSISLQGDAVYSDDLFFTNANVEELAQESYWLVGGNIAYKTPDERWDFRLWGKNLTDEEYLNGGFEDFIFFSGFFQYPGTPRIVGISANYNF